MRCVLIRSMMLCVCVSLVIGCPLAGVKTFFRSQNVHVDVDIDQVRQRAQPFHLPVDVLGEVTDIVGGKDLDVQSVDERDLTGVGIPDVSQTM